MNPYPEPNSVIVLDNCSTHKSAALREVVEQSGTVQCLSFRLALTRTYRISSHFPASLLARLQSYRREFQLL
jgi:hypothetical protein